MATDKKSVLLYCDIIHTVEKLIKKDRENGTNNAGELFFHYLQYINDQNPYPINDVVDLTFEPIKQNLKRDLKKWEGIKEGRSLAGKASAEKRKQQKVTNSTSVESVKQNSTNPTVKDNVKDKVKEINVYRKFKHLSISNNEFKTLEDTYTKQQIDETIDSIENFANNKKYTSLYLTARNWLKKEHPEKGKDCPYTETQIRLAKSQMQSGGGLPEWFDVKYKDIVIQ